MKNPARYTNPPKYTPHEMRILNEEEINSFLIWLEGKNNEALYYLAITTGLRQSELLALQWSDINWEKKTLYIGRQLKRKWSNNDYFSLPKTQNGIRTITLGSVTIQKLQALYRKQQQEADFLQDRWHDHNLIFPSNIGTPRRQSNLYRKFKTYLRNAGIKDIRFHDLRHTAASIMINHGIPISVITRRLGHSKSSITLDTYGHLIPSMETITADKIDEIIAPLAIQVHKSAHEKQPFLTN